MGLFSFGSKKDNNNSLINWISLTDFEQLEEIKNQSKTESILIFKHSTRCGISSMVINRFEKLFNKQHQYLKVYYLDLLNYRTISDEVGYMFQVLHQSPQLIVVKNEVAIYNASHYDILETDLTRFI